MSDIFVSYAHEDRDRIAPLVQRLETERWSVWWDRELIPGDRFEQAIDEAISRAKVVVVAWSRAALDSNWVHNEALDGLERGILVPVLLDTVRVPVAFRQMQAARLQSWPDEFEPRELDALFSGIREVLEKSDQVAPGGSRETDLADLAELHRLKAAGDVDLATRLAADLSSRMPDDPEIESLWREFSSIFKLESDPSGAQVSFKSYERPADDWQLIGTTPSEARIPNGLQRFRITLAGYDEVEMADTVPGMLEKPDMAELLGIPMPRLIQLQAIDPNRDDMVFVPGGEKVHLITAGGVPPKRPIADYFVDRFPVTNADFKEFVDAGGYDDAAFWVDTDLATVKSRCIDSTSKPGPAAWRFGNYPEGDDDYPVTGISWHEAAAFARFRGGMLPTAAHWNLAAREYQETVSAFSGAVVAQSNFGDSLRPVHESTAIGAYGVRDIAGNAREWVRNEMRDERATLGACHRDPGYMFIFNAPADPWQRDGITGFRTIVSTGDDTHLERPIGTFGEPRDLEPVSEDVFDVLSTQFTYNPQTPQVTSSEFNTGEHRTRLERLELRYPDGTALTVFIQQLRQPARRQPIVVFPGQSEFFIHRSSDPRETFSMFRTLVESGRTLVMPVYHGSNERYAGVWQMNDEEQKIYYRDTQPVWHKEIGQTVDYLATRDDIIHDEPVFLGASYGVAMPLPAAIMEQRFRAFALLHGGLVPWARDLRAPISDMKNFLPRLTRPTFLLSGRYDTVFPLVSQEALYQRIGTPEADKTWIQYDGGHGFITDKEMLELVNWLDGQ
jgi:dienelactone hydrolase